MTVASLFSVVTLLAMALQPSPSTAAAVSDPVLLSHPDAVEPCDASFPLAPASALPKHRRRLDAVGSPPLRVVLPSDPSRRSHAPLCPDGLRIDFRRLERCPGSMCWVEDFDSCFHLTSRECIVPPASKPPTRRPTFDIVDSVHPVKLTLKDVPQGYMPSLEVRSILLRFAKETLEEGLRREGLELVRVEYAGRLPLALARERAGRLPPHPSREGDNGGGRHLRVWARRRLEEVAIALRVTVRGPTDISDLALSYIMDALRDRFGDLKGRLRRYAESLDDGVSVGFLGQNTYDNVSFRTSTYDFDDLLTAPTDAPTFEPTRRPTGRPTRNPSQTPSGAPSENFGENGVGVKNIANNVDGAPSEVPWWVWLLIVLLLLLLCICCVLCCVRSKRRRDVENGKSTVNVWVQRGRTDKKEERKSQLRDRFTSRQVSLKKKKNHQTRRSTMPHRYPAQRPPTRRLVSQTELDEVARREYEVSAQRDKGTTMLTDAAQNPRNLSVSTAVAVDPPEENVAIVLYNPGGYRRSDTRSSEDPDGISAANLPLASDSDSIMWELQSEDPDGYKFPKDRTMYASEVYSNSPVVSGPEDHHRSRSRQTSRRAPRKDTIFTCSMEDLQKSRDGHLHRHGAEEGRRKKRKSKTKKKRRNGTEPEGRLRDASGEERRHSRTRKHVEPVGHLVPVGGGEDSSGSDGDDDSEGGKRKSLGIEDL